MVMEELWREQIIVKLGELFEDLDGGVETYTRIMWYLNREEMEYNGNHGISPCWRTLKNSISSKKLFKTYAKRMAEDTKTGESSEEFRKTMGEMYETMLKASENVTDVEVYQQFDPRRLLQLEVIGKSALICSPLFWSIIPVSHKQWIMNSIESFNTGRMLMTTIDDVVDLVNVSSGSVVMVGLAAITLGFDVYTNIRRWLNGEITGIRCCKNVVDSAVTIAAGVGGGMGGAAIGAIAGPIGALAGGIVGSVIGSHMANALSDRMTQWLFGVPKEESLENAFNYFGLKMNASNHEINTSFRKLCLRHHPDKGGNPVDFYYVQMVMAIIKVAKGDEY